MIIEYYTNNIEDKEIDIKNNINIISTMPVSDILCNIHNIKYIRKNTKETTKIGCLVDYPLSSCCLYRRQDLINDAIDYGAGSVSISIPFYYMINRKYDKIVEDINKNYELCKKRNVHLKYILEYRKFEHSLLAKICELLIRNGVDTIYASTGFFLDNIEDNILACAYLNQKTKIKTIVNGNIWLPLHVDAALKIKPYGISINNISGLETLFKKLKRNEK